MKAADFRVWHEAEMPKYLGKVRYWVNRRKMLAWSFSGFDPRETLAAANGNTLDEGSSYQGTRFSR
jgi:hypothetical protein